MVFISSRRRDRRILRNPLALPRGKIGSPCRGRGPISSAMKFRALLLLFLIVAVAACQAPYKKKDDADKQPFKDQSGDQAFQAFLGRLRLGVDEQRGPRAVGMHRRGRLDRVAFGQLRARTRNRRQT